MSRISGARMWGAVRSAARGTLLVAGLLGCGAAMAGTGPERAEAVVGQWELSRDQTGLKCRLALRIETAASGVRIIALPYGCRKAFPILADVQGWTLAADGRVVFLDSAGVTLLRFTAASDERLTAAGPGDEIYLLTAAHALARADAAAAPPGGPRPTGERRELAAKGSAPAATLRASDLSGRYAVLREGGKDTGCMVTLDDKASAKGGSKAFLAPACRDQGIVIFDPIGWRIANGRLVLTARKGHSTSLDLQPDGTWLKDPKDGKSLALKKL
jgi:hypothetical protein